MPTELPEQIISLLKSGNLKQAADLFVIGQNHGLFMPDHTLTDTLIKTIGKSATKKLITAFAHYPCQFCSKGRTKCENCDGHGKTQKDTMCERCAGLGIERCDFCNGSGWLAIEDLPKGLHTTVLVTRIQTALARLKLILAKPVPTASKINPKASLKESAQTCIYIDRFVGVLENMLIELKKLKVADSKFNIDVDNIKKKCVETALNCKKRMSQIIQCMADSQTLLAQTAPKDSAAQNLALEKADYYKSMADKSDKSVNIDDEHPFLEKAIKEMNKKQVVKDNR